MVSNKKARSTMKLLTYSDKHRPINKRVHNKVIITLWAHALPGTIRYSSVLKK